MTTLLISAISLAVLHSLAPDHWLPFVALAKSSRWSRARLTGVTTVAGLGHVVSSLFLGAVGLLAGLGLERLQTTEHTRALAVPWLIVGFGVAYAFWGLKHAQHPHPHVSVEQTVKAYAIRRMWMLMAIVVFGPCEPLIPLMFLAYHYGWAAVLVVSALFSAVTVGMIVGQSLLAHAGAQLIRSHVFERYAHTIAGVVIALTGVLVLAFGI